MIPDIWEGAKLEYKMFTMAQHDEMPFKTNVKNRCFKKIVEIGLKQSVISADADGVSNL